jgi:IS30 family transposase
MIEHQARFTILVPNPDRQPHAIVERISQALQGLPEGSYRTITFDRGTESAAYSLLADRINAEAYLGDPHSLWQSGAVENATGRLGASCPTCATWLSSPTTISAA